MKIFIEDYGWLSMVADTLDEKRELEKLYDDAQEYRGNHAYENDDNIKWELQNYKLMFKLRVGKK